VLYSRQEDVTLGIHPFGPFARGWQKVAETAAEAASRSEGYEPEAIPLDELRKRISDG
jgi:hypothetical protein